MSSDNSNSLVTNPHESNPLPTHKMEKADCLTCADVLQAGSGKIFSQKELSTLSQAEEINDDCLAILGKNQLDISQAQAVWTIITQMFGSPNEIPEEKLRLIGWVAAGIPVNDFYNLSFSDVDTIASLGQFRNLSQNQLVALKDSIFNQWSGKDIRDLTNYDLVMFRSIICAFNATEIGLIRPESYKNAASELGTLKQECPVEITKSLAQLATDPSAFGDPSRWTSTQVAAIGCVMTGLRTVEVVPAKAMEGISIEILNCLPPRFLEAMSVDQLSHFPAATASSLSSLQSSALSYQQRKALDSVAADLTYNVPSASVKVHPFFILPLLAPHFLFPNIHL
ncbi:unnamed protein product [Bemisia tabaci]|uniref:Uncharacterized protein n=1 Tax=Bemisia tabaci TaxID=7038 RepID=A0A9P0AI13_BEMTA|nr:unnamed protein product [Bemisia tabaci]